jgi:hypothetical protein
MDQIVFVFDLEQVVPLEKLLKKLDESLIEARLNNFKQAVLRIATFCSDASKISEGRRDLPSLGFRLVDYKLLESFYTFIFVQILQFHGLFLCPTTADRKLA